MARKRTGKRDAAEAAANGGAVAGHEAGWWATADAARGSMGAAEYRRVVPELMFVRSFRFVRAHPGGDGSRGGAGADISLYPTALVLGGGQ